MSLRIVYQLSDEPVASLTPCECGLSIQQIAVKDVPQGAPFWIVDESIIPLEPLDRLAWHLSADQLGGPSGWGLGGTSPSPDSTLIQ